MGAPLRSEIKVLIQPQLSRWLVRVLRNWVEIGIVVGGMAWAKHPVFYLLGIWVLATRQHALAIMGHDGAHYSASTNRAVNDWLSCLLTFWPMGMGIGGYRKFHFLHHSVTGKPDDPELIHKRWASPEWSTPITRPRILYYLMRDLLGFGVRDIYRVIRIVRPATVSDWLGPLIWWSVALCGLYKINALWIAAAWLASLYSAYWAVFRIRMWTEHTGTTETHRVSASFWQKVIFLPHNTWCHYEHHRYPAVPCWNLPIVRNLEPAPPSITVMKLLSDYANYPTTSYGLPQLSDSGSRKLDVGLSAKTSATG